MQKYGLQLRTKPPASSQPPAPASRPLAAFADDEEEDVEAEILRQASKKRSLQKVEEQHKKALEEDPSVFDYDGAYDKMKEGAARPKMQEKIDRKPKYIAALMEKAKQREREQEIIYERKLHKERSKEDHLYAEKDMLITPAYKKKLEERGKWLEEERRQKLREEKEDVTKKKDLSDFYFSLHKNVAFGAQGGEGAKGAKPEKPDDKVPEAKTSSSDPEGADRSPKRRREANVEPEMAPGSKRSAEEPAVRRSRDAELADTSAEGEASVVPPNTAQAAPAAQSTQEVENHYKRSADVVAVRREAALARRRERQQQMLKQMSL